MVRRETLQIIESGRKGGEGVMKEVAAWRLRRRENQVNTFPLNYCVQYPRHLT
jgi:hypothetical protein